MSARPCDLCGKEFHTIDYRRFCTVGCEMRWWSGCEAVEANEKLQAQLAAAREEIERLKGEAKKAQCGWCGEAFDKGASGTIVDHLVVCEKRADAMERQLRATEAERDSARALVGQLVEALEQLETHHAINGECDRCNMFQEHADDCAFALLEAARKAGLK